MPTSTPPIPTPARWLWTGRILSALPVLFLAFDGVAKLMRGGLYLRDARLGALLPFRK